MESKNSRQLRSDTNFRHSNPMRFERATNLMLYRIAEDMKK